MATFTGTPANNTRNGTAVGDVFNYLQGGNDTLRGLGGNDTFKLGAKFSALDRINGGAGLNDKLTLAGNYAAGVTFGAATLVGVEQVVLGGGFNYRLTTHDSTVAANQTLTINASALSATKTLKFNGAKETNGKFVINAGAGNDTIIGGAKNDIFNLGKGGNDTVTGGNGNDTFDLGDKLAAGDALNGGLGFDTVYIYNDGYALGLTLDTALLKSIEELHLASGVSYNLTAADSLLTGAQVLQVTAEMSGVEGVSFNGSAESTGSFRFVMSGIGNNLNLTGGAGDDRFEFDGSFKATLGVFGGGGTDTLYLDGDYSTQLTLASPYFQLIERLEVNGGNDYNIATTDAAVTAANFTVDGSALGASDILTFDGSAETSSTFDITGGAGNDIITDGARDDTITADDGADEVNANIGGDDTINAGAGGDTIRLGATLTANDKIDGGDDDDILSLDGDYSGGVTFTATTLVNVEEIDLADSAGYNLSTADATVAAGAFLTVDGSSLATGHALVFNGSAETDGHFVLHGGAGDDVLTGGELGDDFFLTGGGVDAVNGRGGDDTFKFGDTMEGEGAVEGIDTVNGGTGTDTLVISTDIFFNVASLTSIEVIKLTTGRSYNIDTRDANVADGETLTIDASALANGESLDFDGTLEQDGSFILKSGNGADFLRHGGLATTYSYLGITLATADRDTIGQIDLTNDKIQFRAVNSVSTVTTGSLSTATFDADLTALFGEGQGEELGADEAVAFTPDSGDFAGTTFLLVGNGVDGFVAGSDLAIQLFEGSLTGFGTEDFIA